MNYFSSDWHLGHENVIKFDNRPFSSVQEMNETIIRNVMSQLKPKDNLYYLGDFALCRDFRKAEGWMDTLASSGANLFFIKGNHDKNDTIKLYGRYGEYLGEQRKVEVEGQEIVLNHYAMKVWDKSHYGTWHLYGHSHHSLPDDPNSRSLDCGINGWDYRLTTMEQIKNKMGLKTFKPIDHHGRK